MCPIYINTSTIYSFKNIVKVTAKKGKKAVSKTLKANVKVINAGLRFVDAPAEVVVGSETKLTAKKSPSVANVTFASSDDAVATVDAATGAVKAVKAGKVTITATSDYGKSVATDIVVKKAIVKSAEQTEFNKIEAVIVGDTKDIKAGDIKVTNTATKATVAVKSVAAKKGAENTYVIETFTGMTDAKEYSVEYAGSVAAFTATDNTVDTVALTKTEVPAGIKTEVKAVTKDAKGVILGYFDLTNANSTKGQVTTALTITKGYVQGSDVYLPAVGDTMAAKLTYHTGSFATDGKETGIKEATATITAVDPSTVSYNYAATIADNTAPKWTATSFKAVTSIKVGTTKKAYFRITDENGKEISSYDGYSVETADPSKLVLNAQNLTAAAEGTTGVVVKGVVAGETYILVKKDGKVAYSIPVSVQGKATATTVDLNKTSVTVMSGAAQTETIEAKLKDQYNEDMVINTNPSEQPKVEALACPDGETAPTLSYNSEVTLTDSNKKAVVSVTGNTFAGKKTGTYTYKITLKDSEKKAIVRTFTVNVVKSATVQAYQLNMATEKDTTVKNDTVGSNGFAIVANVAKMANGAKIDDYANVDNYTLDGITSANESATSATKVKYSVKTSAGKDVTGDFVSDDGLTLTINAVTNSGTKFKKHLAAGTYYVTGTFKVRSVNPNTGSYDMTSALKEVVVSGSFTIKDSQDTAVSINVKKNDLENAATLSAAFANSNMVEVTYDGQKQELSGNIEKIHATVAGNTAYVTSVEAYVKLTNPTTDGGSTFNYVLVTIPVNQKFTGIAAGTENVTIEP